MTRYSQRMDYTEVRGAGRAICTYYGALLAILVASMVLLVGCGARSQTATALPPRATTLPTATSTPVPHLAFRPITLPPGFHVQKESIAPSPMDEQNLAVSPVNGKDAWACVAVGAGAFQIWATTDEGATWHAAGLLRPSTPAPPVLCGMIADQRDTQAAVFGVEWPWGSGAASYAYSTSFYTRDGGAHWRQLPGWTRVFSVDTDGANSYALIAAVTPPLAQLQQQQQQSALLEGVSPPRFSAPGFGPFSPDDAKLVVSSDGLQTWRDLHPGGVNTGDPLLRFWHGPTSGDLFVATVSGVFWHSSDGGVNWAQSVTQDTPDMQNSLGMWLASRKAWMFCGWQSQPPLAIMCSMDTGNTWRPTPAFMSPCSPFALEADGSVLAACQFQSGDRAPAPIMMYRLAPGATSWATLGPVPSTPQIVSANDIMWCPIAGSVEWETVALHA